MGTSEFPWPLVSGLCGAIIGATVSWLVSRRTRKQNFYIALIKNVSDHNWSSLKEQIHSGLCVSAEESKVLTLCYQHINLLFFAWLHKDIITKDGSLEGWKRWAQSIILGCQQSEIK